MSYPVKTRVRVRGSNSSPALDYLPGSQDNLFMFNGNDLEAVIPEDVISDQVNKFARQRIDLETRKAPVPNEIISGTQTGIGRKSTVIRTNSMLGLDIVVPAVPEEEESPRPRESTAKDTRVNIDDGDTLAQNFLVPDETTSVGNRPYIPEGGFPQKIPVITATRYDPHLGRVPVREPVPVHKSYIPQIWHTLDGTPAKSALYDLVKIGMAWDTAKIFILMMEMMRLYTSAARGLLSMETGFSTQMTALEEQEDLFRQYNMDEIVITETFKDKPGTAQGTSVSTGFLTLDMATTEVYAPASIEIEAQEYTETSGSDHPVRGLSSNEREDFVSKSSIFNKDNNKIFRIQNSCILRRVPDLVEEGEIVSLLKTWKARINIHEDATSISEHVDNIGNHLYKAQARNLVDPLTVAFTIGTPANREINAVRLKLDTDTPSKIEVLDDRQRVIAIWKGVATDNGIYDILLPKVVRNTNLTILVSMDNTSYVPLHCEVFTTITKYRGNYAYNYVVKWVWFNRLYTESQ